MCESLSNHNQSLKYLYLRNCDLGDIGAEFLAKFVLGNKTLLELDVYNCGFPESGGEIFGKALRQNFTISQLSIGRNSISKRDIDAIQLSVVFNTHYSHIKQNNQQYEGFAHNLIAEQLKNAELVRFTNGKLE